MLDLDGRLVMLFLWGGGVVACYGRILWVRNRAFRLHRDARSTRDLLAGIGLFLTAICAAAAIYVADIRAIAVYVALGAFLAAGIVMATTEKPERK